MTGLKLSPIASLYYIAPTSLVCLIIPWLCLEANVVLAHNASPIRHVGAPILIGAYEWQPSAS